MKVPVKTLLAFSLVVIVANLNRAELYTQKKTQPVKESSVPTKPVGADMYDTATKQWLCAVNKDPLTGRADGYYPCPNGTTESEREAVASFDACVKRSGKEPQSAGWSWAAAQCRQSLSSF